jgi:xanthine dehydrogenase small subunit
MRIRPESQTLLRPRRLDEALSMLRDEGPLRPVAGCTDVMVGLNFGTEPSRRFLDLWSLDELRGISVRDGDVLRLGALTTYMEMQRSAEVRDRLPMLIAAAREVGGAQIQTRGTLAGNIANGSPAGDTLPVLAVAEATVVARSAEGGERRIPFGELYTGYRATVLRPEELITAVEIPRLEGEQWFRKVGTRAAQAISKVVMAAVRGERPRIALGSVGPTVVRLPRTEAALRSGAPLDEALAALRGEITPIDDVRSTGEYRLRVAENLVRECFGGL